MTLFKPYQLRWDKRTPVYSSENVMNFGESKGTEFDHIVIYPPKTFLEWLNNPSIELPAVTKAKLYVAITRAFFSVGIIIKQNNKHYSSEIPIWNEDDE